MRGTVTVLQQAPEKPTGLMAATDFCLNLIYQRRMLVQGFAQHLPAALRDKHNVTFAIPFRVAWACILVHSVSPLRVLGGSR
jgi:hypothetical protein